MSAPTLADRLETAECRRDYKARRVSNVAPSTRANITAEELESGVTLERLDALNVPVLRYSGQVTIHGLPPDFDANARPGGYKAVVKNGNGSVGVRYGAIDAGKKALLRRCSRAVEKAAWHVSITSTGCEVSRAFYAMKEEEREGQKAATLAALRGLPVGRFYGCAFAGFLAYGAGYFVAAEVGAIPAEEVWPLCAHFWGIASEAELVAAEAAEAARDAALRAGWAAEAEARHAEAEVKRAAMETRLRAFLATLPPGLRLDAAPRKAGAVFCNFMRSTEPQPGAFVPQARTLAKRGPSLCYGTPDAGPREAWQSRPKMKVATPGCFAAWDKAAAAGLLWQWPLPGVAVDAAKEEAAA
jgi:hypothetical protein